jgi:hypothetical protein
MQPFKPPSLVARTPSNGSQPSLRTGEPPAKKRRVSSNDSVTDNIHAVAAAANVLKKSTSSIKKFQAPVQRKPLEPIQSQSSSSQSNGSSEGGVEAYFTVLWYVRSTRPVCGGELIKQQAEIHDQEEQNLGWRWRTLSLWRLRHSSRHLRQGAWPDCMQRTATRRL